MERTINPLPVTCRMRAMVCFCLLAGIAFAGCVDAEVSDPNVTIAVTSAGIEPGPCAGFGGDEEDCHAITVHIVNGNTKEDVSNNMFYYDAVASDGGVYRAPDVEGPDAFAPGGEGDLTLKFDLPSGPTRLTQVRYEAIWMSDPVVAAVPSY